MTVSISGTNGITYPDSTTQNTFNTSVTEIGSIIFAQANPTGQTLTIDYGETRSGTLLWYTNGGGQDGANVGVGTWQCLGWINNADRGTAWQRIS